MEQEEAKTKSHTKMYYTDVGEVDIVENDIIVKREIFENLLEIATLRNMGLTAHPNTVLSETKKASSEHIATFHQFFEDAVTNNYMVALFIDDFHNIHSYHRPSSSSQLKYAI